MPDPGKKVANTLVAMSSAAILAVYSAGYTRTRAAARRMDALDAARLPVPVKTASGSAPTSDGVTPPPGKLIPRKPSAAAPPPVRTEAAAPTPVALPEPPVTAPAATPAIAETLPAAITSAPPPPPPAPAPKWKDGTYYGWGTSRHGDIQAAVTIESGRIASATIAQCLTRYSCSVISALPPEVPQRQSAEVDYVSGATQSANAFYYAVLEALGKAK